MSIVTVFHPGEHSGETHAGDYVGGPVALDEFCANLVKTLKETVASGRTVTVAMDIGRSHPSGSPGMDTITTGGFRFTITGEHANVGSPPAPWQAAE